MCSSVHPGVWVCFVFIAINDKRKLFCVLRCKEVPIQPYRRVLVCFLGLNTMTGNSLGRNGFI